MFLYIALYVLSIFMLYIIFFHKIIYPVYNHVCILLLNDGELRGGGGLITQSIEIWTFLGIPYKVYKHSHDTLHQYCGPSFYPFNIYVTPDLLFRDTNYSFFQNDNFARAVSYYKKNFPNSHCPTTWVTISYSFIEQIFIFPFGIKIAGLHLVRKNLFRSLSHLVGDNTLPANERKFILIRLLFRWALIAMVPGVIYYVVYKYICNVSNGDIVIWKNRQVLGQRGIYLGLNENNLKGRKSNRYMKTEHEYIFHVTTVDALNIGGNGKIIIKKIMPSSEHFPFVGQYHATFDTVSSDHFQILGGTHLHHELSPQGTFFHEIPFNFTLPRKGNISILRQACLQNTYITTHIDVPPFCFLPKTNLDNQIDHWHYGEQKFESDFLLKYDIIPDNSPLRMTYRGILDARIVQISFQKPVLAIIENYTFSYADQEISIDSIDVHDDGKVLIFQLCESIPLYDHSERDKVLRVTMSNVTDITGMQHYIHTPRTIWFPWN